MVKARHPAPRGFGAKDQIVTGAWSFAPTADEKLRITDAEADGQAAVMFLSFWDQNSRQGVVGFGSSGDEKLRIRTDAATAGIYLLPGDSILDLDGVIRMQQRGNALADVDDYGQWWVKNDTPTVPRFTDDAGVDGVLGQINILQNVTGAWNFLAGSSGTDFLDSGGTLGLNIAHDGGNDVTIVTVGTVQDVKFSGATVQYDFDNEVVVNGNFLLEGDSVQRAVMRTTRVRVQPGATPGTNINCTNGFGGQMNDTLLTNATNLAKSGSSGGYALDSTGKTLTMDFSNVYQVMWGVVLIHDINSSSTSELYTVSPFVSSSDLKFNIYKRGSSSTVDITTIADSGDLMDIQIGYIANS